MSALTRFWNRNMTDPLGTSTATKHDRSWDAPDCRNSSAACAPTVRVSHSEKSLRARDSARVRSEDMTARLYCLPGSVQLQTFHPVKSTPATSFFLLSAFNPTPLTAESGSEHGSHTFASASTEVGLAATLTLLVGEGAVPPPVSPQPTTPIPTATTPTTFTTLPRTVNSTIPSWCRQLRSNPRAVTAVQSLVRTALPHSAAQGEAAAMVNRTSSSFWPTRIRDDDTENPCASR